MADDLKHSTTISKKDQSFPDYLDFDKLRSEGIEYLGQLAGQIWTDHNVHDPGITILEMLCYALLDLGYRTNLPLEDILTRNPDDTGPDNNFFTPAKILACNPLTVTDFRKLLIDLEEVRNAWLEPATDIKDFCRPVRPVQDYNNNVDSKRGDKNKSCESFLNGLYHVYLDLEKDIDSFGEINSVFENETQANEYKKRVIQKVKRTLMAHRNFCEDFADILILCKLPMGVCAEIELEDNFKADEMYITIAETLRDFFTPSPRFYTLQQLLDKQKSIEEIFEGRPYDVTQSHGFVDTDEFEALKLRKEIHLSDVYNVIFKIEGVRSVRNLSLRLCDGTRTRTDWKFPIKKNHIPEFSIRCSGFRFTRNDIPISVDFKKYESLFDLNISNNGKVLYQSPSPYLDTEIPKGTYRRDLADYYSIQNEFPRVYAIDEGSLTDSAPDLRKAQALQLKGYLLFFDQLLANYLAQLNNIRSLFALDSPKNEKEQHTYFINQLNTVPELQKLLRFSASETETNGSPGSDTGTLVFPIDKNHLIALKDSNQLKYFDLQEASPITFSTQAEKDIEVELLKEDLYNDENISCEFITKHDGCVFYYLLTSSDNIALVSKKYFSSIDRARENSASVKYIGTFDENYRSFVNSDQSFSFTIEMNLASFAEYLQLLVEDRGLYLERRQDFLQNLLARFAETFTDFALLTFGNTGNEQVEVTTIEATEKFLTHYDNISSNRGKAFDYWLDGWNNENISGFEKRVKSLAGIDNWKRRTLCNFEVYQYDEQFTSTLKIDDQDLFALEVRYDSREEALQATRNLFTALSEQQHYIVQQTPGDGTYSIAIYEGDQKLAIYQETYAKKRDADTSVRNLYRIFSVDPVSMMNPVASGFDYHLQLMNYKGMEVCLSSQTYDSKAIAKSVTIQLKQGVNDEDRWEVKEGMTPPNGPLYRVPKKRQTPLFIDLGAFKCDVDNTLPGKPDNFSYHLLDRGNRFKFRPLDEFDSEKQAREHWQLLLSWMTNAENYRIQPDEQNNRFVLRIVVDGDNKAFSSELFDDEKQARQAQYRILSYIRTNCYKLAVRQLPNRWKFMFRLGLGAADPLEFMSLDEYPDKEKAINAAQNFDQSIGTCQVWEYEEDNELRLVPINPTEETSSLQLVSDFSVTERESLKQLIKKTLSLRQEVSLLKSDSTIEAFDDSVKRDYLSEQGLFVYRLVDKDTVPACFSEKFAKRATAEERLKNLCKIDCDAYSPLELCLGGSIFNERRDEKTGSSWYHYLIRSQIPIDESDETSILFESTQGYQTEEEAETAFTDNYLQILEWASHAENYGTFISMKEKLVHQPIDFKKGEEIVFVPQTIRDEWGDQTKQKLMSLAKSYPIRLISEKSDDFYKLFPCEEQPEIQEERICKPDEDKFVYYFRLYGTELSEEVEGNGYWQSTEYYKTPGEARLGYRFFRMLLCYPGNFFVRCDPCHLEGDRYRICLREVLAESTARFESEEKAWGKEGVQKLICVSQSKRAFHPFRNERNGCNTFYLACEEGVLYHPCRYDTPQKRDQSIDKLWQGVHNRDKTGAWQILSNEKEEVNHLLDETGAPFAKVSFGDNYDNCQAWAVFFGKVLQGEVQYETTEGEIFSATDEETGISVQSVGSAERGVWKNQLEKFACYYPIVKRINEKTGREEYCIEIHLPGFTLCDDNPGVDEPCGCNGKEQQSQTDCHMAWISSCCFASCQEAEEALRHYTRLLLNYRNYRPLYECDCYDFGIALHYNNLEGPQEIVHSGRSISLGNSEMVALNPQCYSNPDEVCSAIKRSWKLINAEGLHVAEHILLRPRCNEDCRCEVYSATCENKTGCEFKWSESEDDPCFDLPDVCFIPGADPYSFIATVALPAWPTRFRNPENRKMLEHILYREAPAHVLLRILWLAPHDFCCFESKYKHWNRWLAPNESCIEEFSNCDFLEFLFQRNYECLDECDVCGCRDDKVTGTDFCLETWNEESLGKPNEFLNQINELYCWREQDCYKYDFTPCNSEVIIDDDVILLSHRSAEKRDNQTEVIDSEEGEGPVESDDIPLKPKPQVVNSRMARYRSAVDQVLKVTNQHTIAEKAKAFVTDPQPSADRATNLLMEILKNKKPQKGKVLTKTRVVNLLQNVLCYYLDKICFNGKDLEHIEALQQTLEAIREAKMNVDPIDLYDYWKPQVVRLYEPETDIAAIRRIITGEGDN